MENEVLPQYMRIAASVASHISMGEYQEGRPCHLNMKFLPRLCEKRSGFL